MDHTSYQTFKIIVSIFKKTWRKYWVYVNTIENRFTFKIKTGYYLELLTPGTMKLLETTENKTNQDKNGVNLLHLDITEAVLLVHCNKQWLSIRFKSFIYICSK